MEKNDQFQQQYEQPLNLNTEYVQQQTTILNQMQEFLNQRHLFIKQFEETLAEREKKLRIEEDALTERIQAIEERERVAKHKEESIKKEERGLKERKQDLDEKEKELIKREEELKLKPVTTCETAPCPTNITVHNYCGGGASGCGYMSPQFDYCTFAQGVELGHQGPCTSNCPGFSHNRIREMLKKTLSELSGVETHEQFNEALKSVFKNYPKAKKILNESFINYCAESKEAKTEQETLQVLINAANSLCTGLVTGETGATVRLGTSALKKPIR